MQPDTTRVRRPLVRRSILAIAATLITLTMLLVGAGAASATSVTGVTFTPDTNVSQTPAAVWTIGFTPSGTGALATDNAVAVTFPTGFDVSGAVGATGTGFAGCGTASTTIIGQVVLVQLTGAGCTLDASTPATVTITGISAAFSQYSRFGFSVSTYATASFSTPIDGSGANPPSFINITASLLYAATTSDGSPTTAGMQPVDPASPYTDAAPTATVLGNTGSLELVGYTFVGWCTTDNAADPTLCTGTQYAPNDTLTLTGNTILYSVWELTPPPTCTPGNYLVGMACVAASPGSFVAGSGATSQTPCAPGSFAAGSGASVCTPAPAGKFVAISGATTATDCAVDSFTTATGSSTCSPCPSGTGTAGATGATACVTVTPSAPTAPTLTTSQTAVECGARTVLVTLAGATAPGGLAGYSYVLREKGSTTVPDATVEVAASVNSFTVAAEAASSYELLVVTVDNLGRTSTVATATFDTPTFTPRGSVTISAPNSIKKSKKVKVKVGWKFEGGCGPGRGVIKVTIKPGNKVVTSTAKGARGSVSMTLPKLKPGKYTLEASLMLSGSRASIATDTDKLTVKK